MNESLCCTPSKISQSPMTNTVWFHLCGILWGVKFMGSRMGTWWLEATIQGYAMRKVWWLAARPWDCSLLPSCTHEARLMCSFFIPSEFWKRKMTVYKSSSYYTLTEITKLKLFLHVASVRACVRGAIFSAFLRHKHPSVPFAQPAFAFLSLCQPSAHVFYCKLHSRLLESRRGKIPQ